MSHESIIFYINNLRYYNEAVGMTLKRISGLVLKYQNKYG